MLRFVGDFSQWTVESTNSLQGQIPTTAAAVPSKVTNFCQLSARDSDFGKRKSRRLSFSSSSQI